MTKNILIDIYKAKDLYSGLGEFSFNFAKEISSLASKDYNLNFLVPGNIDIQTNDHISLKKTNFQKRYLPCLNEKYDIWHCLHQFPAHLPHKSSKLILTVHDLNFLLEKRKSKALGYLKRLQENINRASIITVISDYTKKVVLENLDIKDKPIYRIYNGVKLECYNNVPKPDYMIEVIEKKLLYFHQNHSQLSEGNMNYANFLIILSTIYFDNQSFMKSGI